MSKIKVGISTTVKIPKGPPVPPIEREIEVEHACPYTVNVPHDAPGNKSCFQIWGGLKESLKLLVLNPIIQAAPAAAPAPAAQQAVQEQQAYGANPPATNPLAGFWFSTSDDEHHTSGHIPLTGAQLYSDNMLALLFGSDQKKLEKITFYNPTGKCVEVTIIVGCDLACPHTPAPCH